MTDLLTNALRELESDAPDTDATRDAVYQGIQTRARHRRIATVTAAAIAVAALAGGTLYIGGAVMAPDTAPGGGGTPALVPVDPAELTIALKIPRMLSSGRVQLWDGGGMRTRVTFIDESSLRQHAPEAAFTLGSGWEPPETMFALPHNTTTTVRGKPATMRTYVGEERTELYWKLSSGGYAWVESNSASSTRAVANALEEGKTRGRPPFTVGLMPRYYLLADAHWSEVDGPTVDKLRYCPLGKLIQQSRCFHIAQWDRGPLKDGPQPGASRHCTRGTYKTPLPTFGRARQVGEATVRLSSDGCYALKQVSPNRWMAILAPANRRIVPDDFARMAASIQMRR